MTAKEQDCEHFLVPVLRSRSRQEPSKHLLRRGSVRSEVVVWFAPSESSSLTAKHTSLCDPRRPEFWERKSKFYVVLGLNFLKLHFKKQQATFGNILFYLCLDRLSIDLHPNQTALTQKNRTVRRTSLRFALDHQHTSPGSRRKTGSSLGPRFSKVSTKGSHVLLNMLVRPCRKKT